MDDAFWRFDWAPTAEEWQAFWAMLGVVAALLLLYVAWKQLSGLAESNLQLARSNELLTESNKALSRPLVVVEYEFRVQSRRNYASPNGSSTIFVVIRNVGQTPARDLFLTVDPPFESTSDAISEKALGFLANQFSGTVPIRMLTPGQKLMYALDEAATAVGNEDLPDEYQILARFTDVAGTEEFEEEFVLQMSPWALSVADQDPLRRISRDIQFVSETLKSQQHGIPKIAAAVSRLQPSDDVRN